MIRAAAVLAMVLSAPLAMAQTIGLPTQGRLLDTRDEPVTGRLPVTFALYGTAEAGTALWSETVEVAFDDGFYSATLGTVTPISEALFEGEVLFLGVSVDNEPELTPRLKVSWVPFAVRALQANSMQGGVIDGATISNATFSNGQITGTAIEATTITADSIEIGGQEVGANSVPLTGGTMSGPLAAPQIVSTGTDGPPLQVASSDKVDNLNADLLDGQDSTAFWSKTELTIEDIVRDADLLGADFSNLLNNGDFNHFKGGDAKAANWWREYSTDGTDANSVGRAEGYAGNGLFVRDSSLPNLVSAYQRPVEVADASVKGSTFTASVRFKRISGTANGSLCIGESDDAGSESCTELVGTSEWQVATVSHTASDTAAYLQVVLKATRRADETAEYAFDHAILVRGSQAPSFRPSERDGIPSGLLGMFPFECPEGWERYAAADGRTLVGVRAGGTLGHQQGSALANNGTRVITDVPRHVHSINPPSTGTSDDGAHTHKVDPASVNTTTNGNHRHAIRTRQDDYNSSGGNPPSYTGDTSGSWVTSNYTQYEGSHAHSVNIPSTESTEAGRHGHTVDIAPFDSASTGSSSVDVTMPYVQVAICQAL